MVSKKFAALLILALSAGIYASGQDRQQRFWAPKGKPAQYTPPHKPHTKLSEVKQSNAGKKDWSYVAVDDDYLHAAYISSAPGSKEPPQMKPDTVTAFVVLEGQIRFSIEGQEPFTAAKNSMVQVPFQTIYSMETLGNQPAIRFEVNIANAKTMYATEAKPATAPGPGLDWLSVRLNRMVGVYTRNNKPHIRLGDLPKSEQYRDRENFLHRFVEDDRMTGNVIYGYQRNLPPLDPDNKGHYHPECAEFWLIMAGQIRYPIEGHGVVVASEGDVVYVPPFTFHAPRFWGDEVACRLAFNGYPNISHLVE